MPTRFAEIAFTPSVRAAQVRYGSREANRRLELAQAEDGTLTSLERDFIAARDSFYQATVSESGWPYVQHKGGPSGFLKTLDERTLGYADFSGNRQYVSAGNLAANDRVALILVDYAARRRLKIWGRARIAHAEDEPQLMRRLQLPAYRADVERGVVIVVEAHAWNCPRHIPRRFSLDDVHRAQP